MEISYFFEHGIRAHWKSHSHCWSRSWTYVATCIDFFWVLLFMCMYGLSGLFHCIWRIVFNWKHFLFHSKRFMFSQDTTIFVKFKGISSIIVLIFLYSEYFDFFVYIPSLCMFLILCLVRTQKTKNILESVLFFVYSLFFALYMI